MRGSVLLLVPSLALLLLLLLLVFLLALHRIVSLLPLLRLLLGLGFLSLALILIRMQRLNLFLQPALPSSLTLRRASRRLVRRRRGTVPHLPQRPSTHAAERI